MSSRAATREYSHFLVKYDDSILYTCPRVKILTDGRVRIGSQYPVIYGNSTDQPETALVVDTGDYLQMKKKEAELSEPDSSSTRHSPINSSPHSPAQSSPQSTVSTSPFKLHKRKRNYAVTNAKKPRRPAVLLSVEDGINDPYQYRSPSTSPQLPLHLSAPTPPSAQSSPRTSTSATQTSPTHKEPTAFSLQRTLGAIYQQLEISNARQSEMERLLYSQQQKIDLLVALQRQQVTVETPRTPTPVRPLTPRVTTPSTPTFQFQLQVPTTPTRPDSPVSPAILSSSRQIPTPLFNDIPESVRLSDDDLSKLVHSTTTAGGLAVCLLRHLYPELFTEDQLRVYFSYRGGGKLSKKPLDDTRKQYIRRYVTAFYPQVSTESAYHALVVEKINQYLRRPVQQKK